MNDKLQITPLKIFIAFASVGLRGFGGVMPFVHNELVEKRKWLSTEEFTELIAIGQILPGANVTNFASMFGYRVHGWSGAAAAVSGLVIPPLILLLTIYHYYKTYSEAAVVQGALKGILAVAAGLVFVTAYKMIRVQKPALTAFALTFLCVALVAYFKVPLIWTLLTVSPLSIFLSWKNLS